MHKQAALARFRFSLRWLLIFVPIVGLVLGVAIRWVEHESGRGWSVERLERAIQAANPPISNREHAEEWLKTNGIAYRYIDDPTGGLTVGRSTAAQLAGLSSQNLKGVVRSTITGDAANVGFYSNGEIYIFFFIDSNGVCVGHWIHSFEFAL